MQTKTCHICAGSGRVLDPTNEELMELLAQKRRMTWDAMSALHNISYQRLQKLVAKAQALAAK